MGYPEREGFHLWCYVKSIQPNGISFHVINGNWVGWLGRDMVATSETPSGTSSLGIMKIRIGDIPDFRQFECYNEALEYINAKYPNIDDYKQYLCTPRAAKDTTDFDDDIPF